MFGRSHDASGSGQNQSGDGIQHLLGLDGLAAIRQRRPDLIHRDMQLPDISGLELLRRLRTEYPELPLLMLSTWKHTIAPCERCDLQPEAFLEAFLDITLHGLVPAAR